MSETIAAKVKSNWSKPSTSPLTAPSRFEAKWIGEPNSGCWLWIGGRVSDGNYGGMHDGERVVGAHHYSWRLHRGPIPKGMYVCHSCDTPSCVNPDHLFIDTPSGNQQDMIKEGRSRSKQIHWAYSDELKTTIQQDDRPISELVEAYGLSVVTIKYIKSKQGRGMRGARVATLRAEVARLREAITNADLQLGDGHIARARETLHAAMDV